MKKLLMGASLAAIATLTLASCSGSSEDLTSLRKDSVSDSVLADFNLSTLGTHEKDMVGKKIYTEDRGTKKSYYDIYIAEDGALATTFVYSKNLSDMVEDLDKKVKNRVLSNITVNTLTFTSTIYTSEVSSYLSEFYNKKYGLTSYTLDENKTKVYNNEYDFAINSTVAWSKTTTTMKYALEAYKAGVTDISVQTAYLPTYFVRTYKSEEILKCYVFTPIYIALVDNTTGKEIVKSTVKGEKYALADSPIASFTKLDLDFNEKGLLVGVNKGE